MSMPSEEQHQTSTALEASTGNSTHIYNIFKIASPTLCKTQVEQAQYKGMVLNNVTAMEQF